MWGTRKSLLARELCVQARGRGGNYGVGTMYASMETDRVFPFSPSTDPPHAYVEGNAYVAHSIMYGVVQCSRQFNTGW